MAQNQEAKIQTLKGVQKCLVEMKKELDGFKYEIFKILDREYSEISHQLRKMENFGKSFPIRQQILGEWKMVEWENLEGAAEWGWSSMDDFRENLKFALVDGGKLKQSGAGVYDLNEIEYLSGSRVLYVEGDHVKTTWCDGNYSEDIYIENGRLHFVEICDGVTWKRIYEKV